MSLVLLGRRHSCTKKKEYCWSGDVSSFTVKDEWEDVFRMTEIWYYISLFHQAQVEHYFILLQFAFIWTSFFQGPKGYDSLIKANKFHKYFLLLEHCFSTLVLLETPKKKWGNFPSAILLLHVDVPGDFSV